MNKLMKIIPIMIIIIFLLIPNNVNAKEVTKVSLNKTEIEMDVNEEIQLKATVRPRLAIKRRVVWRSSDDLIASVDNSGLVKGIAEGDAIITAESFNGTFAECKVHVNNREVLISEISLNKSEMKLSVGRFEVLMASLKPSDAINKELTWTSSDEEVVKVFNGFVFAVKPGNAMITVTSSNDISATCNVIVEEVEVQSIQLDKYEMNLLVGEKDNLTAFINPENASNKELIWTTTDDSIAEINNGEVIAKGPGKAIITVTSHNGIKATCDVSVENVKATEIAISPNDITLIPGEEKQLEVVYEPSNAVLDDVEWNSSDENIASVTSDGLVKAINPGEVIINVTSGELKAESKIRVHIPAEGIELNKNEMTLKVGDTESLVATLNPTNSTSTFYWASSNPDVVLVENGLVKAVQKGKATITVITSNDKSASCTIEVIDKEIPVTSVTLDKKELKLDIGASAELVATVNPSDASDKSLRWNTSDEEIAKVEDGVVTGLKKGTAIITVTASSGHSADCKVDVDGGVIEVQKITLEENDSTVPVGTTLQLNATITPSDATDKTIIWRSSNPEVASVSDKGLVKGLKPGKVTITAVTPNHKKATCTIRVNIPAESIKIDKESISINKGLREQLTVIFNPENTTAKAVTWESSNPDIATVDKDGIVRAKEKGTATIKATSKYGKTATCEVTVTEKVYYVSPNGDDRKSGKTPSTAVKTIKKGVTKLDAGSTLIVEAGTYKENDIVITVDGTMVDPIKIVANGNVVIDGGGNQTIFKIKGSHNLTIDGFTFKNLCDDNARAINIVPAEMNLVITNCKFEDIKIKNPNEPKSAASAIYIQGSAQYSVDSININNCTMTNIESGHSEAISVNGNCTNITIDKNRVTYTNGVKASGGIGVHGGYGVSTNKEYDRPRNVIVRNCRVSYCKSPYENAKSYGINIDGAKQVKIYNNVINYCDGAICINALKANSKLTYRETEDVKVYNNTIKNSGIATQIGSSNGKATVWTVKYYNNTIENCGSNGEKPILLSRCKKVTINNCTFDTKENKTFDISKDAKDITKSNNTFGKK